MSTQLESWRNMALEFVPHALAGHDVPRVLAARQSAFTRFAEHGFPTRREEEWKYTDVSAIGRRTSLAPDNIPPDPSFEAKLLAWSIASEGMHLMVFVNGHYDHTLSMTDHLPHDIRLTSLAYLLDDTSHFSEKFFDKKFIAHDFFDKKHEHTTFSALNNAFATDGAVLYLAPDMVLDVPIYLLFIASGRGAAIYPRNIIIAGENSRAKIIEHYIGTLDVHNFTNAMTQINIAAGAEIEHCKLLQEGPAATHIAGIHAEQATGSLFISHAFTLGGHLCRNDITTQLNGTNSHCELNGLYLMNERQHVDHHTRIDHIAPESSSQEHYRGVLDGSAHGVFNGKVVVHPRAVKTNAHQVNHNLLLSRQAEVDTKPQLEIFADDVQCTHGVTVGQLDEDSLFYLRSRGIDADLARSVLTYGFANDIIERVSVPYLRTRIEHLVLDRLPQGDQVKDLL
ncbi:FeS cluster assembly protein SufD [mine drainage metagenome]|uniref:FeS cluster assembly protein SufD n=1 Tax=mine drainage metagenome TaxID=410659 RepID=A0A1J5S805_9ZZZZ